MSGATPHLLSSDEVFARLLAADIVASMRALSFAGANVNRPVGLRFLAAGSVQDANRAMGNGALQNNTLAIYTLGR